MKVVVTGATGFIGRPLCAQLLGASHTVTVLSRSATHARAMLTDKVRSLTWNRAGETEWKQAVAEADAVVNLAGEPLTGQRWTEEVKARIRMSRIEATRSLVDAMRESKTRPKALVSASAIGYYGDRGDEDVTENSPAGTGFLADLSRAWEEEAQKAEELGVRVTRLRLGVVLGEGGALAKIINPLPHISPWKLGVGGPLGNGKQWMSWIHIDDAVAMFAWAVANEQVSDAVNATAPTPVTAAQFAEAIGRALHRPSIMPVPGFALKLALGEFAESLLGGQRVRPLIAQSLEFPFRYTTIDAALRVLLRK